jgi:hypothetical protein
VWCESRLDVIVTMNPSVSTRKIVDKEDDATR